MYCIVHFVPDAPDDFAIDSLLEANSSFVVLFLGPTFSHSCFTINAINDAVSEVTTKRYRFIIETTGEGPSPFQVSPSSSTRTVTVLDDDCK